MGSEEESAKVTTAVSYSEGQAGDRGRRGLLKLRVLWYQSTFLQVGTPVAILLYLDTNVFCRPFDDQTAMRVREETEAFTLVLEKIKEKEVSLVTSDLVLFELRRIISAEKRMKASVYLTLSSRHRSLDDESLQLAREIVARFKVGPRDSLHLASALLMEAQYFLTCDDGVTKRLKNKPLSATITTMARSISVMNPVDFVQAMGW